MIFYSTQQSDRAAVLEETPLGLFQEVLYTKASREAGKQNTFPQSVNSSPQAMLSCVASLNTFVQLKSCNADSLCHCWEEMHADVLF